MRVPVVEPAPVVHVEPIEVARHGSPPKPALRGAVTEAAVWSREISTDEVAGIANGGSLPTRGLVVSEPTIVEKLELVGVWDCSSFPDCLPVRTDETPDVEVVVSFGKRSSVRIGMVLAGGGDASIEWLSRIARVIALTEDWSVPRLIRRSEF